MDGQTVRTKENPNNFFPTRQHTQLVKQIWENPSEKPYLVCLFEKTEMRLQAFLEKIPVFPVFGPGSKKCKICDRNFMNKIPVFYFFGTVNKNERKNNIRTKKRKGALPREQGRRFAQGRVCACRKKKKSPGSQSKKKK